MPRKPSRPRRADELEREIRLCRDAWHEGLGRSSLSDADYDALVAELRVLRPSSPVLSRSELSGLCEAARGALDYLTRQGVRWDGDRNEIRRRAGRLRCLALEIHDLVTDTLLG